MNHIMVVDDDTNFRMSLVIQLELEGYKVTDFENPNQALAVLEHYQNDKDGMPELIISDVCMPEVDGEEFVDRINERFPRLPVLVISAFDPPVFLSRYPFLQKPFKLHDMMSTIQRIIRMN